MTGIFHRIKLVWSRALFLSIVIFAACCAKELVAADLPVGSATFNKHVAPFLQQYCIRCHGAEKSKGNFNVQRLNADFSAHNSEAAWESILNMLELGEMPPAD
jgi:cytochrome c553